jgi:predicted ATPase
MVKQELQMHRHCEEIALGFLSEAAVSEYLQARFPGSRFPAALARLIHRRTEGNPLFMVNMVDYLVGQAAIAEVEGHWQVSMGLKEVEGGVPESLRRMIEKQIEELAPQDRRLLEVASVAGVECSAAAVAAGLEEDTEKVEERCEELVRKGQFLRARESKDWPDGTVAGRYGFIHALYQEVLYDRVTRGRRIKLHRKIGERQEAGYGERRGEIAGELAIHFERGRDYRRAVQYLQQAAENALRRCAYQETISNLTKALELLKTVPDTPERAQQELTLHMTLGTALVMTKGYAAPEVGTVYSRARELCRQVGETPQLFPVLWGLWVHYFVRGDFRTVRDLSEQLLRLARNAQDPALLLEAQVALGLTSVCLGEVAPALTYLEQGIALYDPQQHRAHAFVYGQDPGMVCLSWAAWALWLLGYPDQALKRTHEALALAQELAYPFSSAYALGLAAVLHQLRREGQQAQERAEEIISLATEQGFALWLAAGNVFRGWALADQGQEAAGMAQLSQGLAAWQATGAGIFQSYGLALLTEACGKGSRTDEGLAALNGALTIVENSGERWWEAELQRLKGQLTLQSKASQKQVQGESKTSRRQGQGKARARPGQGQDKSEDANTQHPTPSTPAEAEAEACFVKAIEIARRQGAKLLELRATVSLARLWQQQGKQHAARNTLSEIYGWFTEVFDTKDLQEAKALLEELSH